MFTQIYTSNLSCLVNVDTQKFFFFFLINQIVLMPSVYTGYMYVKNISNTIIFMWYTLGINENVSNALQVIMPLELALSYMKCIQNAALQYGVSVMMWHMFLVKKFSASALLIEKVGKAPKDRLCRKVNAKFYALA